MLIRIYKKADIMGGEIFGEGITYKQVIAWLEKQCEPQDKGEISDGYHTFNELYYYRMLYNAAFFNMLPKEWVHKSKRHNDGEECFGGGWFIVMANLPTGQISNHYELKDWDLFQIPEKEVADKWDGHTPQEAADRLHKYLLEKQGEQKPADKIEPKFKVGDWIVNKGNSYLIADIDYLDNRYLFEIGGYTHEQQNWEYIKNADEHYHLWTIQDAKDGDVIDFDCGVGIFKNLSADGYNAHCYCYYDINSQLEINDCSLYDIYNAEPATKEQCDTLFAKMKEAGYEWSEKDRKLIKME